MEVRLSSRETVAEPLIEPPLTPRAGLDMDDDPVLVGPVKLLIQQAEELFVART